jgi:hypothetical protein
MGIKLMRFFIIFFVIVVSCAPTKRQASDDFPVKEEDYIKAYKTVVLFGCLNEGTKGSFSSFLKENNDLGLFSEVDMIFHSTANTADSIGREYSKKIEPFTYGDGKGKNPTFSRCVLYALSREVDSLAKESYKQSLKEK